MKKLKFLRKLIAGASVIWIAVLVFAQSSLAQVIDREVWRESFISKSYRPRWFDRNENFGRYDLRKYPESPEDQYNKTNPVEANIVKDLVKKRGPGIRGPITPVTYDQFGNFLLPGGEIYSMNWNQSRLGATTEFDNQWINSIFNNLVISADEFSNWQTKFMISRATESSSNGLSFVSGGIRAYFTPSTMKITNFDGFRWDASSRKNNVSIVASAGERPIYGAHWESILGDVLKVGATFVSQQRGTIANSHQDIDRDIKSKPRYIYLMVTDDSPEDTGPGAKAYGINSFINGQEFPVAFKGENYPVKGRVFKVNDLYNSNTFKSGAFTDQYMLQSEVSAYYNRDISKDRNERGSWLLRRFEESPGLMDELFDKYGNNGYVNVTNNVVAGATTSVWDPVALDYVDIANDTSPQWDPDVPTWTDDDGIEHGEYQRYFEGDMSKNGYLEAKGTDVIIYELLLPYEANEVSFNVTVSNDYCIDIVAALYQRHQAYEADWYDEPLSNKWDGAWSVDASTYDKRHCVKAPGNVKDDSNMRVVKVRYNRLTGMNVYGMNMELDWRGLFVRAEYNEYNTFWSYPVNEDYIRGKASKETSRAWFVNAEKNFGTWSLGAELFDYPMEYMQYWATIDDNDDNDRYVGTFTDGTKRSENPGLDADFDRYIDTDWQGAPFLNYYYDTIKIGDDFNHNGIVDSREDDHQIDLPYEQDSKGQHYFVKINPRQSSMITLGHYDVSQEYLEGRNFTRYMKLEHHQRVQGIGEFFFYHKVERVRDNYKMFINTQVNNTGIEYDERHREAINNWSTTNVISSRLNFIPNTNIINNIRYNTSYDVGNQLKTEGTTEDIMISRLSTTNGDNQIKRYGGYSLALEHKVDYVLRIADARLFKDVNLFGYRLLKEKRIKELKFMPMIKVVHSYGYSLPNNFMVHDYDRKTRSIDIYPILRFDYRVAPKTLLRFGVQGFSGFKQIHREKSRKLYDTDRSNMILAFENRSLYSGFNLVVLMGMRYSKTEYNNNVGKRDPGSTQYFITVQSEARQEE